MFELREIENDIRIGILDLKAFAQENGLDSKREIEKGGTVYLLKHLLKSNAFELAYSAENKPFLKGRSEHISISHSHQKLAIIINELTSTGIDIEMIRDKVINIQQKFLNKEELAFANNNVEKLVTLWAAKETLYKIYGLKEIEFVTNLSVDSFEGSQMIGKIRTEKWDKQFLLQSETIENYKLVYALHEL